MKLRHCRSEVMAYAIVKFCALHKVKLSVPPSPAGTSLAEGILHAPKVCLSCRKAHLVEKRPCLSTRSFFWWERVDSNHRSRRQQIYSLPPLATREHSHIKFCLKPSQASSPIRTHIRWSWWTDSNPRPADYKSAALPTELHQHFQAPK